jgi:protein-L-isoaspartate(D-aspartate) O-methyltransferase
MAASGSSEGERDGPRAAGFERAHKALLGTIEADARMTARYTGRDAIDPRVMAAMAAVPRHEFVPEGERDFAYHNEPLPIGHGQTISQPYVVALMTDLLKTRPEHVVLEVGTGSGYQAAVLAKLVQRVYSIEVIAALAEQAKERLARLGYDNVEVRLGDGALGWPEHAPFDGIIVTAAARKVEAALVDQLRRGGRMVIPVGGGFGQDLLLLAKAADGTVERRSILPVAFVPLTRPG